MHFCCVVRVHVVIITVSITAVNGKRMSTGQGQIEEKFAGDAGRLVLVY